MTIQPLFEPTLEEIHVQMAKLRLGRKRLYYSIAFYIIFETFVILSCYVLIHYGTSGKTNPYMDTLSLFIGFVMMLLLIPHSIHQNGKKIQDLNIDLLQLSEQERKMAADPTALSVTKGFFKELVGLNIKNLSAYYDLIKDHTQKSFLVSIVSGIFGFGLIMFGLYIGIEDTSNLKNNLAYLSAASGIIIEFIAGIFFYLYNKTVRELKEYHNSLLDVQNILLSFNIVQKI